MEPAAVAATVTRASASVNPYRRQSNSGATCRWPVGIGKEGNHFGQLPFGTERVTACPVHTQQRRVNLHAFDARWSCHIH
jgi:hypothetical protein